MTSGAPYSLGAQIRFFVCKLGSSLANPSPQALLAAPLRLLSSISEVSMLDIKKDIQAMTTFRRNPRKFMKHRKENQAASGPDHPW
jgi:hypothetical protein